MEPLIRDVVEKMAAQRLVFFSLLFFKIAVLANEVRVCIVAIFLAAQHHTKKCGTILIFCSDDT